MTRHGVSALSAVAILFLTAGSLPLLASSHVRIVRLSLAEGQVQMDRATGEGLERAILNTPVVEGTRLVTGADGLAEVEFENQSALRLTGDSEVKFSQLLMNDAGAKINQIQITKGLVYLDTASKGDDIYRLTIGSNSFLIHRDSQLRVSVRPDQLKLAVFKGDVQLENQPQPVNIQKKETLTLDLNNASSQTVAKSVEPDRFDNWNKEREDYSKTYAENEGYGGPSRGYGLQDLNYYGGFFYAPGYGYAWQPYGFANAMLGWDPYSNGAWMFYPGFGYSWASAYPWGWLPFHYGSWAFINGAGWAWLPGGGYGGPWYASNFTAVPKVTKAPAGWTAATPPAMTSATNFSTRTVLVGKAANTSLSIPGGRIPPDFGSLVPGRAVASNTATHGFAKPAANAAANHNVFAAKPNAAGHVFAAPSATRSSLSDAPAFDARQSGRGPVGSRAAVSAHSSAAPAAVAATAGGAHK